MYNYQIMSNSFGYVDIILLGMIAGFIILRLRSIQEEKPDMSLKFPMVLLRKNLTFQKKKLNQLKKI